MSRSWLKYLFQFIYEFFLNLLSSVHAHSCIIVIVVQKRIMYRCNCILGQKKRSELLTSLPFFGTMQITDSGYCHVNKEIIFTTSHTLWPFKVYFCYVLLVLMLANSESRDRHDSRARGDPLPLFVSRTIYEVCCHWKSLSHMMGLWLLDVKNMTLCAPRRRFCAVDALCVGCCCTLATLNNNVMLFTEFLFALEELDCWTLATVNDEDE